MIPAGLNPAPCRVLRAGFGLGLGFSLLALKAQAGISSPRLLAAIAAQTPAATRVERGTELQRAGVAAAAIPGAEIFQGVGASMEPLFPRATAVVVAPVEFRNLRKGMTVVYRDRQGRRVAHALTGDVPQGWVAQGVHNDFEDDELVTPQNLVGVVVQAFAARPT